MERLCVLLELDEAVPWLDIDREDNELTEVAVLAVLPDDLEDRVLEVLAVLTELAVLHVDIERLKEDPELEV